MFHLLNCDASGPTVHWRFAFKQMHTIPFPEKVRLPWGLNTTIALDKELHFCETGNRLALEYLKISRDVLNDAEADESADYMKCRITSSFDALINHTCRCPTCLDH